MYWQGLLGQHYVERLDALYFYNPPSVFWGLWNSLKGLLPEVTRSKIKVIDPSDLQELQQAVPPEVGSTEADRDRPLKGSGELLQELCQAVAAVGQAVAVHVAAGLFAPCVLAAD